jgi:DNA primase
MKTEGLSFPEAVERLAEEAGVVLPKPDMRDERKADELTRLAAVTEAAQRYFVDRLQSADAADARRYLERRGLKRETIARFGLGFAPAGRTALKDHLGKAGFAVEEMVRSGMLIGGDDIPVPYDRFRNRVTFPIADLRERIIAFGGRALDPSQPAKYLNSPETPLFHKGHMLFNAARARGPAHDNGRIIVVEGYMDAISLAEAGFEDVVAPLGTALTPEQIKLLWRMAPEPTLCFDGDSAGRKAAFRAVETVLPILLPGQSLKFAFLPDGLDPDDLIRANGAQAMAEVLERTEPLVDMLWDREWGDGQWTTPERRAQFERQILGLVAQIGEGSVRSHYEREIRAKLDATWAKAGLAFQHGGREQAYGNRPQGSTPFRPGSGQMRGRAGGRGGMPQRGGPGFRGEPQRIVASSALKRSGLGGGETGLPPYREALLMKALLNHPAMLEDHAEEIATLEFRSPAIRRLRDALLSATAEQNSLDRAAVRTQLQRTSLYKVVELVERAVTHRSDRFAEPDAEPAEVEAGWRHALALHIRQSGLVKALKAAQRSWDEEGSEDALARICEIQRQLASTEQLEFPPET